MIENSWIENATNVCGGGGGGIFNSMIMSVVV